MPSETQFSLVKLIGGMVEGRLGEIGDDNDNIVRLIKNKFSY